MIVEKSSLVIPEHIAIIMDGNGRWAKKKGANRIFGHKNAISAVKESVEYCAKIGVSYLTLYAFSTENWSRPKSEVQALMSLLIRTIVDEESTLMKNNIKIRSIGDVMSMPSNVAKGLEDLKKKTEANSGLNLVLALNYSGRWDLESAVKKIIQEQIPPSDINTSTIKSYLSTTKIPDPDLLIRTSGEQRLSNFLLWECAYTELYFTDVLWPDFRENHLEEAILSYSQRERRFGKTSEQLMGK